MLQYHYIIMYYQIGINFKCILIINKIYIIFLAIITFGKIMGNNDINM